MRIGRARLDMSCRCNGFIRADADVVKTTTPQIRPSSDSPHHPIPRPSRSRRAPSWLLCLGACLLPVVAAQAQSPTSQTVEYTYLANMVKDSKQAPVLALNLGTAPDTHGMVGHNKPGSDQTPKFQADEQRGAFDSMVTGIMYYGTSFFTQTQCNQYVSDGMLALTNTYALQTPNGDFYDTVTENADGTVTGSGSGTGCQYMRFFLAYSNHALLLLRSSPTYSAMYATQINNLLPKIKKSLDFFAANGFSQSSSSPGNIHTDVATPNRDLICACANGLGNLLLCNNTGSGIYTGTYMAEADKWIDNYMQKTTNFFTNMRALADIDIPTYIPFEGNKVNGWGYDVSYTGVGLRFLSYYLLNLPGDMHLNGDPQFTTPQVDPYAMVRQQGYFLSTRFFASDPRKDSTITGPVVDGTNSTRTGPIGGVYETKTTDEDVNSARWGLLYYDAIVNAHYQPTTTQITGLTAAQMLTNNSPTIVATPSMPAQIVNDPSTLALTVTTGLPIKPWPIFASNAGIMGATSAANPNGLLCATTDPGFSIKVDQLPTGLSLSGVNSYPQTGDPTDPTTGNVDQSVGWVFVQGTVPTGSTGPVTSELSPYSSVVSYTPAPAGSSAAPTSATPTKTQLGIVRQMTITVVDPPKVGPTADSYVWDANPGTNYGTDQSLQVKSATTTGTNRIGYLKFTPAALPVNTVVIKAVLQLEGNFGTDNTYTTIPIACYGVPSNSWTESGITWSNRPGISALQDTQNVTHPAALWSWDVSSFVQSQFAAGITTISLAVESTSTATNGGAFFNTRENPVSPPKLVIYYQTARP